MMARSEESAEEVNAGGSGAVSPPVRSLVRKLAEIMALVERVPKNGHNTFQNYKYATEADIAAAVRSAMAERNLMLFPSVQETQWSVLEGKNSKQRLCSMRVRFTIEDGDSGEQRSFEMWGEGQDSGDKASYKAITGAEKYALLKLFLIPTGDDPEADSPKPASEKRERAKSKASSYEPSSTAVGGIVRFGDYKGRPMSQLSDAQLRQSLELGLKTLKGKEAEEWASKVQKNIKEIEDELMERVQIQKQELQ